MANTKYGDATKQLLATALKDKMSFCPLEKITIRELVEACDFNRQTFYYHFEDIYDLLKWTLQQEAVSLLEKHEGIMVWQDGLLDLFRYLESNRDMCLCALHSLGRDHLKRFFHEDISVVICNAVEEINKEVDIAKEDRAFISHVYTLTLAGVVESWLLGEMEYTPEQLIAHIDLMLKNHIRGAQKAC
jgi:probable dihydroxyacetone kinase regulator